MKYFLPLCLFVFWIQSFSASAILVPAKAALSTEERESENKAKRFGSIVFDIGISRFNLLDSQVKEMYYEQYGKLALMPDIRLAYFFNFHPFNFVQLFHFCRVSKPMVF